MLNVQLAFTDCTASRRHGSFVTKSIVGVTALRPGGCHSPIFGVTSPTLPPLHTSRMLFPELSASSQRLCCLHGYTCLPSPEHSGPSVPNARIQCYPLQDLATFSRQVLILLNDIIYPYSYLGMPRLLVP